MAKVSLLFCFSIVVVFGTILNLASSHTILTKPVPDTVKEVDTYVLTEVMAFITEIEKNCPTTKEFDVFFQKLKDYVKFACPISSNVGENGLKINKTEMDLKAGKVFHAMVALQAGEAGSEPEKMALRKKQMEGIQKFNGLQDIVVKIETDQAKNGGQLTLTSDQKKSIEMGILGFVKLIKQIVKFKMMTGT